MKTEADLHIEKLHTKAKALLKQDLEEDELIEELKKEGIDTHYAQLVIENVKGDIRDRADARKLTFMGTFFIVGGIYINYFSYLISVNANANTFLLLWGIVVVGILMLVRAFFLFRK
ncbi:MAG: hypothetical protein ACKOU7_14465 [Ferruginibacter sp.]